MVRVQDCKVRQRNLAFDTFAASRKAKNEPVLDVRINGTRMLQEMSLVGKQCTDTLSQYAGAIYVDCDFDDGLLGSGAVFGKRRLWL